LLRNTAISGFDELREKCKRFSHYSRPKFTNSQIHTFFNILYLLNASKLERSETPKFQRLP